ncbi:trafficking protein particle complex subunit 9-like [Convolutriloba macropyga]|uniref:trafficking protein particle complex subunit 9-like n=1 Tax=Convolutriloba macropyga TaxID=536237 RepID=UPI003F5248CB
MSTAAYNPRIEDFQCINIYVWRPASFNSSFFKKMFDKISESYSKVHFSDLNKTIHYSFTYCQRQPQVEWQLNTRLFGMVAFFDYKASQTECEQVVKSYLKERDRFKSSLLVEYFVFVDSIDAAEGNVERSNGSGAGVDEIYKVSCSAEMHGCWNSPLDLPLIRPEKRGIRLEVHDLTAAGVGGGGSGSGVGGSSHNYPPDFLASGDLYGYAVVSATALKTDFLAAVPAISNALKSVYNCLETCRVHVESYAGDELPTKVPRSPKARAAIRSLPDLTTSYLYPTGKATSTPTKAKLRKQLADVTMMTGNFTRALEIYQMCVDSISYNSDPFWYASAAEGRIAASFLILYPENAEVSWHERVRQSMMFFGLQDNSKMMEELTNQLRDVKYVGLVSKTGAGSRLYGSFRKNTVDSSTIRDRRVLTEEQMIQQYHSAVFPHFEKGKTDGLTAWAEAMLRRALLKEHIGYERASVRNSAVSAHKQIQDKKLPEHVKIRSNLVTANLLFQSNFVRQAAFYMFCATADSALGKNSSKPLAGIRYIHQILPIHLVDLTFGYKLPEETGGWAALHCHLFREALIPCASKLSTMERRVSKKLEFWYRSFVINSYHSYLGDDEVRREVNRLTAHVIKYGPKYAPITITTRITLPPVQFTQLPQVKHFSIERQSVHHQPRSHKTVQKNQVYILQQRGRTTNTQEQQEILWPKKESQHFVMVLYNPLPVKFPCKVQIAYKGAEVQLREIKLDFEPKQQLEVSVDILPVSTGEVEFTGYQLVCFGGYKCFVGVEKIAPKNLKDCVLKARIVEPAPLLKVRLGEEEVDRQVDVELWCGETQSATLTLTSEGKAKPKIVELELKGKEVREYSDPMKMSWDKEGLRNNGKADICLHFLSPHTLVRQKTDISMELKLNFSHALLHCSDSPGLNFVTLCGVIRCVVPFDVTFVVTFVYQATSGSTYYRQQDIDIRIFYFPLLCLRDVRITPHLDVNKFNIRLLLLNGSPHAVKVESSGGGDSFTMRQYTVSRNLITCTRSNDFPTTDLSSDWLDFVKSKLNLTWSYQNRKGSVNSDPDFVARVEWWRKVMRIPPMKFHLLRRTSKTTPATKSDPDFLPVTNSIIKMKQATTAEFKVSIMNLLPSQSKLLVRGSSSSSTSPASGELYLQCVVGDQCERQPCFHQEAEGTNFAVVLGTDTRILRATPVRRLTFGTREPTAEPENFTILATYLGEFSLYFVVTEGPLNRATRSPKKDPNDSQLPNVVRPAFVSQNWTIHVMPNLAN